MTDKDWNTKYQQLSERSGRYSSQLWQVPFAYIGLVGIGIDKILKLASPMKSIALFILGMFSLSVLVHITSIKYYERRTVRNMQEIENKPISSGGSPWHLSYIEYTKLMILFVTYSFFGYSILTLDLAPNWLPIVFTAVFIILTALVLLIYRADYKRTKALLKAIRRDSPQ